MYSTDKPTFWIFRQIIYEKWKKHPIKGDLNTNSKEFLRAGSKSIIILEEGNYIGYLNLENANLSRDSDLF